MLSATIRARPGYPATELEDQLRASGIVILERRIFDHGEDRVFELKLAGPARQFEVATDKLLSVADIYGVHVD